MAWVRVPFPQRGNAGRGLGLRGKIMSMNWEVLDLRCLSGFQKESLKCNVEMAQHGWELQWLIQDVRLMCIHLHWTEDPRVYQWWWCNEPESQTQKVQTEAGGQYRLHGPGLQSMVVTCLYCFCRQQRLIYHCLCNFILEMIFFSSRKKWWLNAIWHSVTKHSSDPIKHNHEGKKEQWKSFW